jgi:hypothetical protein
MLTLSACVTEWCHTSEVDVEARELLMEAAFDILRVAPIADAVPVVT